jgi:cob(I)alamin adenosyltransferase
MSPEDHKVHVYCGYGKGKTTAGLGLSLRAAGAGRKVAIVQFDKGYDGKDEHYSERHLLRTIPGIELHPTGCERMQPDGTFRFKNEPRDVDEARRGLGIARDLIEKGSQGLLVLDEILAAVLRKLLGRDDVMALLDLYDRERRFELVLTGHEVWDELVERADLVTEMRKVKHYFDDGTPAREGIEY